MSVEVEYTVYLKGSIYTEDKEGLERKGYTVIPETYNRSCLHLKKRESGSMIYKNLMDFIGSFEEDVRFNYKSDYFLDEMEICINKIKMDINLNE